MFLKNKHVIVAMLVAPVLAVIAYFATDFFVGEKPHKASAGNTYQLVERPNCRYASGKCELKNGNFLITLTPESLEDGRIRINLASKFDLQGVKIALVRTSESNPLPADMASVNRSPTKWTTMLPETVSEGSRIQLVVAASESLYYGDVSTAFFEDDRVYKPDSQ